MTTLSACNKLHKRPLSAEALSVCLSLRSAPPPKGEAEKSADFGVGGGTTLSASLRSAPPPKGEAEESADFGVGGGTTLEGEAGENADFGVGGGTTLSASLRSAPPPEGEAGDGADFCLCVRAVGITFLRLPLWGSCHAPA